MVMARRYRDAARHYGLVVHMLCAEAQIFGGFGAMRCVKVGEFSLLFFSSSLYWVALF